MKIPFGKHKGRMLVEVMAEDPQYVDWMMQQAWFAEKFKPLYELAKAGLGDDAENTPAHNAMQARFLDPAYCAALAMACRERFAALSKARFEDIADVRFVAAWWEGLAAEAYESRREVWVELKSSLGDDYPAVIRQVKAQQHRAARTPGAMRYPPVVVVLTDQFSAQGVTLEQARTMFEQSGIRLVLSSEIDARMEDARRWVERACKREAVGAKA